MTSDSPKEPDDPGSDPLVRAAGLRRDRHARWLRDGEMPVGRRLAQIGVLGWILVTPALCGLWLGRWLDAGEGIFWSAPLMMLGLGLGGWTAWKWMNNS